MFREWDGGDADEAYEGRHQRLKDEHGFKFGRQAMALIKRYAISDTTPSQLATERARWQHGRDARDSA